MRERSTRGYVRDDFWPGSSSGGVLDFAASFRYLRPFAFMQKIVSAPEIPAAASIITVSNLIKQFGRFAALRGVTADFDAGKFYAILGDNGAGKTTLLRALAGLAHPTRGTVSILGKSPQEACCEIGYMAHPSLLYDEMSGMENLRYFARLYDILGDGRCGQAIRSVRLDPELRRPVGQYSQGMRQRMSLARAILHDPKILLLDEPFSNVDVHSAQEMVALLKAMRDEGKTIFVVTHQALLLEGVADEFVWMEYGKIVERTSGLSPKPTAARQP
jgi:ABC-type multidrug transport system ATPase subunit